MTDADDRRRRISPELLKAIQECVTQAFEENAHRCLVGFTTEDRANLLGLKMLIDEYPPNKLRESFKIMAVMIKARNLAGNIILTMVLIGIFGWSLHKMFPSVWEK